MDDTMTKDEKKKKKGLVLIISVGGKPPKKPEDTADPDDKKKSLPHQMMDMGRFASFGLPPEVLGYGAAAGLGLAASGYGMAALDAYMKRRQLQKLGYTPETHPQYYQEQN